MEKAAFALFGDEHNLELSQYRVLERHCRKNRLPGPRDQQREHKDTSFTMLRHLCGIASVLKLSATNQCTKNLLNFSSHAGFLFF